MDDDVFRTPTAIGDAVLKLRHWIEKSRFRRPEPITYAFLDVALGMSAGTTQRAMPEVVKQLRPKARWRTHLAETSFTIEDRRYSGLKPLPVADSSTEISYPAPVARDPKPYTFNEVLGLKKNRAQRDLVVAAVKIAEREGKPIPCGSPSFDKKGNYVLGLDADENPIALKIDGEGGRSMGKAEFLTRSILFMDVKGYSGLTPFDIQNYATKAMPALAAQLKGTQVVNTWGDAIVATFDSVKMAAENALRIRNYFNDGTPNEGVAPGLHCRVALHVGEILVCPNAITGKDDIFGDAVHMAARLEPVTEPKHIFCTSQFADALRHVSGVAPKAWSLGKIELAKKYGTIDVAVITGNGESDPTPHLKHLLHNSEPKPAPAENEVVEDLSVTDIKISLETWLKNLPDDKYDKRIAYASLDQDMGLPKGSAKKYLAEVVATMPSRKLQSGDAFFVITYVSPPRSGGRGSQWDRI